MIHSSSLSASCWTWRCLWTQILTSVWSGGSSGTFPTVGATSAASSSSTISLWNRHLNSTSSPRCSQLTSWCLEVSVVCTGGAGNPPSRLSACMSEMRRFVFVSPRWRKLCSSGSDRPACSQSAGEGTNPRVNLWNCSRCDSFHIQQKTSQALGQTLITDVRITVTLRESSVKPNYQKEANLAGLNCRCVKRTLGCAHQCLHACPLCWLKRWTDHWEGDNHCWTHTSSHTCQLLYVNTTNGALSLGNILSVADCNVKQPKGKFNQPLIGL